VTCTNFPDVKQCSSGPRTEPRIRLLLECCSVSHKAHHKYHIEPFLSTGLSQVLRRILDLTLPCIHETCKAYPEAL
jgi:hypothetical protein